MLENVPELPATKRPRTRRRNKSVAKDTVSPFLKKVQGLDTEISKLLEKMNKTPEARHDTVDEALSLARECFHVALTRLEKMKSKTDRKTASKTTQPQPSQAAK